MHRKIPHLKIFNNHVHQEQAQILMVDVHHYPMKLLEKNLLQEAQISQLDVPGEPVVTPQVPGEPVVTPQVPGEPVGPFEDFSIPNVDVPDIYVPDVKRIIEEPAKEITGSLENTLSTINPNIPVSTLMIVGVVAVVAIGAGVASFSRHHHGHNSTSQSAQDQTQQDDTEEEQIYEDVQIVTQGGIEEV